MMRLIAALLILALTVTGPAFAQPSRQSLANVPALIAADNITYDRELGIVTAEGSVEITQGERTLLADRVTYSEKDNRVTATGNVSVMEPSGDVMFADFAELTDEMKNGFVSGIRVLMADNTRMAGNTAERRDGNRTVLKRAVYSPCNLCAEDPSRAPVWQIRARQVVHDEADKEVRYRDATFEAFGIPIAYSPYFSHPDPTVKRQSGFLTPNVNRNNFFGVRTQMPYFWAIDESSDLTLTTQVTTKRGLQLAGDYRQRLTNGEYRVDGSVTRVADTDEPGMETRYHIRGQGRFAVGDYTRPGFDIFRASDDTYTRRYNVPDGSLNTLVSRVYSESFRDRDYLGLTAMTFQGLRKDDDPGQSPYVLPILDYQALGEPDRLGGRLGFNGNVLSLFRTEGTDTRRISGDLFWQRPFTAPMGDIYTVTASMRGDGYWVEDFLPAGSARTADERNFAGRAIPSLTMNWRMPFVRSEGKVQQIIEPIAEVVLSPYGGNPKFIPNEDSQSFEFDETNLFARNRFPGIDRVDSGPRASYGLRYGAYGFSGGYSEVFVGQSVRAHADDTFATDSGLDSNLSDYVTRVVVSPASYFSVVDRLRISQRDLEVRRHEVTGTIGPRSLQLGLTYAQLDRNTFTKELQDREAVAVSLNARLTEYYSFTGQHLRDLGSDGGPLRTLLGIRYLDECTELLFFVDRSDTIDRDIKPATTFGFRLRLLGVG
jgi:LPS-assembly protein